MSSRSSNNGGSGVQSIPAGSRKMVQSLKEIVNCPEPEIYAMLKECNMDPNETVNRLLSQDPFHEVKSKREKKKENKDLTDFWSRGATSTTTRSGRSGTNRYGGRDPGVLHGRSTHKKENGENPYTTASSALPGNNMSLLPSAPSNSIATENKLSDHGIVDDISLVSQLSYQSSWAGVPGQVSMADIVKMGRSHSKISATPASSHQAVNHNHVQVPPSTAAHHDLMSESHFPKMPAVNTEPRIASGQHLPPDDEWVEQPPAPHMHAAFEPHTDSKLHPEPSTVSFDRINQHSQPQAGKMQAAEDGDIEDFSEKQAGSVSVISRKMQEENSGGVSLFDNDLYGNVISYQPQTLDFQHQEVEEDGSVSVSSITTNIQQVSIQEKEKAAPPIEEDQPSVVIPNHLQVQNADCSHLSFGSFGSGISATFSGPFASRPMRSNLEEATSHVDASTIGHPDTRNPDYYESESLRTTSDGNLVRRTAAGADSYDSPSVSQPEVLEEENSEGAHDNQYSFQSPTSGYSFENAQQLNTAYSHSQTSSQMQNLASFSNQAYTDSLPSTLLPANVNPGRDSDLSYLPFPVTQSMAAKYGNSVSSVSASTISMPEALKTISYSSAQPTAQTLTGTSVATGPALPQHIAVHPYSQPAVPLGPFANMMGYPFMHQSYPYMPSAFQQTFGGNSIYHQSLAATLPQFKNSVSVSSLPQSAAIASGYGAFGGSTTIPGNFPLNPPAAPVGTTMGYEDVLNSQYKDGNHLVSLQQNENSAMWLHGPGSRTVSAVPASTYYSLQGQNQQPGGFRQGQQPSQNYGALGYPNFFHSQTGISPEHQQQNPRDGTHGGPQGQLKQSQQIWQNGY